MSEPTYRLDGFEGPLDVLLTLIERHKIDIYDIEISLLLEQYLKWMEDAKSRDLTVTADFVEMASRLVYIKSCSLLPKTEDEEEDPKLLLEQMLIEYAKYKRIALFLRPRYAGDKIFFRDLRPTDLPKPEYAPGNAATDLQTVYLRLLKKHKNRVAPDREEIHELVSTRFIPVSEKIHTVVRTLLRKTKASFLSLFRGAKNRSEIVATFLAVLELLRDGRASISEDGTDPEIRLVRNKTNKEDVR